MPRRRRDPFGLDDLDPPRRPTRRLTRAERDAMRRLFVIVSNGTSFSICGAEDAARPKRLGAVEQETAPPLDDVIADVMVWLNEPVDGGRKTTSRGFGANDDVAIFRDGKILAVIRRSAGGEPEVNRFDQAPEAASQASARSAPNPETKMVRPKVRPKRDLTPAE